MKKLFSLTIEKPLFDFVQNFFRKEKYNYEFQFVGNNKIEIVYEGEKELIIKSWKQLKKSVEIDYNIKSIICQAPDIILPCSHYNTGYCQQKHHCNYKHELLC